MARARYYSPRLDRDLISPLYHTAKRRRVTMTRLTSALVREGLARLLGSDGIESAVTVEVERTRAVALASGMHSNAVRPLMLPRRHSVSAGSLGQMTVRKRLEVVALMIGRLPALTHRVRTPHPRGSASDPDRD